MGRLSYLRVLLRPPVVCAVAALVVAVGALGVALAAGHWSPTALAHVNARTGMGRAARSLEPGFRTWRTGAYDGQFYWGIAIDPVATGTLHRAFDKPTYRYGHPLYGWLGWVVSADQASAVPFSLIAIALAAMAVAGGAAALLGIARGLSGWQGLLVALNPGLINASTQDLAEPLAAALLLTALLALARDRRVLAWGLLALLPLAKEPLLVAVLAVACHELVAGRLRRALLYAAALLPALAWWIYARVTLGAWFTTGTTALGQPVVGWWKALSGSAGNAHGLLASNNHARVIGVMILLCLLTLLLVGGLSAALRPGVLELSYLALGLIAVCLAANATAALTTALRNTAFLLALVPFVLTSSARGRSRSRASICGLALVPLKRNQEKRGPREARSHERRPGSTAATEARRRIGESNAGVRQLKGRAGSTGHLPVKPGPSREP
jgi:hypothetical protein